MSEHIRHSPSSSDRPAPGSNFLHPVGDCVAMKGGTYGSIFWQLLQKRALQDAGYAWCQMEDLLPLLDDMPDPLIAKDILAGKLRQNAGDFLSEMLKHHLIEMSDEGCFRIHASHHRDPYSFLV